MLSNYERYLESRVPVRTDARVNVHGRHLLLQVKGEKWADVVVLNKVGAHIYKRLDGATTVGEVVRELCGIYPKTDPSLVREQTFFTVRRMKEHGLLALPAAPLNHSEDPDD